jgi:hypothetical protein
MPGARSAALRRHWPALVLAVAGGAVAAWARYRLFPSLSFNRDEAVYLWQVDTLAEGRLTSSDGGHPDLFLPWLSAARDGMLFTQYTLGWPLVLLAARALTGSASSALYFGAALAVLGTYAFAWEVTRRRAIATVAAAIMVGSPIMAIQGGVHLSYLFTLGLGLFFGVGLLSGIRTGRWGRLVVAGLLLGWIFFTRPYDGLLWGIVFCGYALIVERAHWRHLVRPFLLVGAGALPVVVGTLAYNVHVTGGPLTFPITEADPMDTFGFGTRRLMPGFPEIDYTVGRGFYTLAKHAFFFPWFLLGSYLAIAVAAVGLWIARRQQTTLLLLLVAVVFPLGYLPFWGTDVSSRFTRLSGPIYFIPIYASVAVLVAIALVRVWQRHQVAALGLAAALVIATVPTGVSRFRANEELSTPQDAWTQSVAALDEPSLVFVADTKGYLLFLNPFSSNGPELDDEILYAVDQEPGMLDLIAEQPQRTPYLQQATESQEELGPKEAPTAFDVVLQPIEVRRGAVLELRLAAPGAEAGVTATVDVTVGDRTVRRRGAVGAPLAPVTVGAPGTAADLVVPPRGEVVVTLTHSTGPSSTALVAQQRMVFRLVGDTVELLLPAAHFQREDFRDHEEWRRRLDTPALRVEVTPAIEPAPDG